MHGLDVLTRKRQAWWPYLAPVSFGDFMCHWHCPKDYIDCNISRHIQVPLWSQQIGLWAVLMTTLSTCSCRYIYIRLAPKDLVTDHFLKAQRLNFTTSPTSSWVCLYLESHPQREISISSLSYSHPYTSHGHTSADAFLELYIPCFLYIAHLWRSRHPVHHVHRHCTSDWSMLPLFLSCLHPSSATTAHESLDYFWKPCI